MASSPITSRQVDGGKGDTVANFNFLGSKINVNGDCSHGIKRCLLLGRIATTNLDSPLNCKAIKPINLKGNQCWIFIGSTDAEAPILWPPNAVALKSQLIRKDPDAGKDRRQEEKGMTEDEMDGWLHWLNGHDFEQAQGDGEGQGSLPCYSP